MTSLLDLATDFEAESRDGRSPLEAAVVEMGKQVARATDQAVRNWAAQCGTTPEEWCKVYQANVSLVPGGGFDCTIRVEASMRGEPVKVATLKEVSR